MFNSAPKKQVEKHSDKVQTVLLIPELIEKLNKFINNKTTNMIAVALIADLKKILAFKEAKDQKNSDEKILIIIDSLTNKLGRWMIQPILDIKINNLDFFDILYNVSISLAKISPRNIKEIITQETINEIDERYLFFTADRHFWDIRSLWSLMQTSEKLLNPATRQAFTKSDIFCIKTLAKANNINIEAKDQKQPHPELTLLDLHAIESILAEQQPQQLVQRGPRPLAIQNYLQQFNEILIGLQNAHLLTQDNLDAIHQLLQVDFHQRLQRLNSAFSNLAREHYSYILHRDAIPLDQVNLNCILLSISQNGTTFLSRALVNLSIVGINTQENREALMQINNPSVPTVAEIFYHLHVAGMLAQYRNYFIENKNALEWNQLIYLAEILHALRDKTFVNKISFTVLVDAAKNMDFYAAFQKMKSAGLLNEETLANLIKHQQKAEEYVTKLLQNQSKNLPK